MADTHTERTGRAMAYPKREDYDNFYIDFMTDNQQVYLCIQTSSHQVYSLYSPEAWQYFCLDRETAELIAKGFSDYWADYPAQVPKPPAAEEAAQVHRNVALGRLAECSLPILDCDGWWYIHPEVTFRDPHKIRSVAPNGLVVYRTKNPFEVLQIELRRTNIQDIPEFTWQYFCGLLFFKLLNPFYPSRDPTVFKCTASQADSFETEPEPDIDDISPLLPDDVIHQRGRMLVSQKELAERFPRSRKRPVQWGPLFYDEETVSLSHFCVSGVTRSGKTTLLKLLFQSLHDNVVPQPRFVLYDAKPDLLPCLFPPGSFQGPLSDDQVAEAVYLLSPFDSRGTSWDIAADAAKESTAAEIAEILFPSFDGSNEREFYGPAVRDVTTELMIALTRTAAQKWTFYDLLCAMQLDNIQSILCSTPNGRRLYTTYLEGKKSNVPEDLPKALRTKSAQLLRPAYAWSHAEQRIGLRQWVRSQNKTIVLFNDDEHVEANTEINRVLLNLLAQQLLAVKEPPSRTYLYLDEMEHLGYIKSMTRLIEKGVGRQVNLAIAFHDLLTLKKVYGEPTEGILSQASFQAFLKVNSQFTCEWASYQIGTPEVKVSHESTQSGTSHTSSSEGDRTSESQQSSQSQSKNYSSRRLVIPDEIRELPLPAQAKVLRGYFVAPNHSPYRGTLPASKVIRSKNEYLAAEQSEENFYALWPTVDGVSEHCPQPDERYELPDDMFRTLYELGFRKPSYSPAPPPIPETEGEESSQTPPPPPSTQLQSPVDTGPTETPETDETPTEQDDDIDIPDFYFPDE